MTGREIWATVVTATIAALLITFCGCVSVDVYVDISETPVVYYARAKMRERHPGCTFDQQVVLVADPVRVGEVCHDENAVSCFFTKTIFMRDDLGDEGTCQALLHEFNHGAALCVRGDWDLEHSFDPDFYNTILFETCAGIAL